MPVRAEAVEVAAADKDGEAVEVAVAGRDGDKGWPADHKWTQTSNHHSRTIPGYQAHIARLPRVRIKTSRAGKAEVRVVSARASRDHEDHIVRGARVRIKTSRAVKAEAQVDSTRADHTARVMDAGT